MNSFLRIVLFLLCLVIIIGCEKVPVFCNDQPKCCIVTTEGGGRITQCAPTRKKCKEIANDHNGSILEYPINVDALDLTSKEKEAEYAGCKTGEKDDNIFPFAYHGTLEELSSITVHKTRAYMTSSGMVDCATSCLLAPASCVPLHWVQEKMDATLGKTENNFNKDRLTLTLDDIKQIYGIERVENCGFKELIKTETRAIIEFEKECVMKGVINVINDKVPVWIVAKGKIEMEFKEIGSDVSETTYKAYFPNENNRFLMLYPREKDYKIASTFGGDITGVARERGKRFSGLSTGVCYSYQ